VKYPVQQTRGLVAGTKQKQMLGNPDCIFLFFSSLMSSSLKHVRNPVVDRLMGKESAGLVPSNLRNDSYYMATHQVRFIEYGPAEFLVIKRTSLIYCRKRKLSSNYYKFCWKKYNYFKFVSLGEPLWHIRACINRYSSQKFDWNPIFFFLSL